MKHVHMTKHFSKFLVAILFTFFMFGCASQQNKDPLEGLNRTVYKFNDVVDNVALKPVAKGYQAATPNVVQKGIHNFFNNTRDVITAINELLQFKVKEAVNTVGRVAVNTTVGLLGVIDIHSMNGGVRTQADFGQTLGRYGFDSGAYLVLPLIGPSSTRDGIGFVTDEFLFDPVSYINDDTSRYVTVAVQIVDVRADLLDDTDIRDQAFDPYAFMRDTYMQYREHKVSGEKDSDEGVKPYSVPIAR